MVGSFGLVSVAPFIALCEGFMLPKKSKTVRLTLICQPDYIFHSNNAKVPQKFKLMHVALQIL